MSIIYGILMKLFFFKDEVLGWIPEPETLLLNGGPSSNPLLFKGGCHMVRPMSCATWYLACLMVTVGTDR